MRTTSIYFKSAKDAFKNEGVNFLKRNKSKFFRIVKLNGLPVLRINRSQNPELFNELMKKAVKRKLSDDVFIDEIIFEFSKKEEFEKFIMELFY